METENIGDYHNHWIISQPGLVRPCCAQLITPILYVDANQRWLMRSPMMRQGQWVAGVAAASPAVCMHDGVTEGGGPTTSFLPKTPAQPVWPGWNMLHWLFSTSVPQLVHRWSSSVGEKVISRAIVGCEPPASNTLWVPQTLILVSDQNVSLIGQVC